MADRNKVSDEDSRLFRRTVDGVTPLSQDRVQHARKKVPPTPKQTQQDERQVMQDMLSDVVDPAEVECGEELLFHRPGVQHGVLRKLRRGQYSVDAELDLHGMTSAGAREALAEFLLTCGFTRARCVRIIHGKGRRSAHGRPVLKNKVNHWLQQRDEVLAFCSARAVDGGTGAVYVLLKRS